MLITLALPCLAVDITTDRLRNVLPWQHPEWVLTAAPTARIIIHNLPFKCWPEIVLELIKARHRFFLEESNNNLLIDRIIYHVNINISIMMPRG